MVGQERVVRLYRAWAGAGVRPTVDRQPGETAQRGWAARFIFPFDRTMTTGAFSKRYNGEVRTS